MADGIDIMGKAVQIPAGGGRIPNALFFAGVEAEIAAGRSVRIRVQGTSMLPLLRDGKEEVLLERCTPDRIRVGEVLLFRYNGTCVLHRLYHIVMYGGSEDRHTADAGPERQCLLMRGDGSFKAVECCTDADVVARVTAVYRPSGRCIPVSGLRWRIPSWLWLHTGPFRPLLLRCIHVLFR